MLLQDSLFTTLTARDLLFDGFTPGVLKLYLDLYDFIFQLLTELNLDFLLPPLPEILRKFVYKKKKYLENNVNHCHGAYITELQSNQFHVNTTSSYYIPNTRVGIVSRHL